MLPDDHPDRIQIAFDDRRLVNNAGLILPATLALHLGIPELVDRRLDLGDAPGRANTGAKIMTLVASALAGGDCIDDADVLRTGGTAGALGYVVKAPSTLGTFLRSLRWGHVRQLDRLSRELLAQSWAAGAVRQRLGAASGGNTALRDAGRRRPTGRPAFLYEPQTTAAVVVTNTSNQHPPGLTPTSASAATPTSRPPTAVRSSQAPPPATGQHPTTGR